MSPLKIVTIAGTRPELIRLSLLIKKLDEISQHVFVFTGQNHDPLLSDVFFGDLQLRSPDFDFGIDTSSPGRAIADTITKTEELLLRETPDAVVILGDTNSSLAAIPAERLGIPVYHLEAGNRSFDNNVPEELNRRLVDHISTFNLPYSESARRNLILEGISPRFVFLSGSPMAEILSNYEEEISGSQVLISQGLSPKEFVVASIHRQENVDEPIRLRAIFDSLGFLGHQLSIPVVVSVHPRTRLRLDAMGYTPDSSIQLCSPFGYLDYMALQINSYCVVSDSGTISEESSIAGFPSVILRDSMERPEALEAGAAIMSSVDANFLFEAVKLAASKRDSGSIPSEYQVKDFSERVASVIFSTAKLARNWKNLR